MNKENTEKLIRVINLLDKVCEYNETKDGSLDKLKSFNSSELSKTFGSLENHKFLFPLNYEKDTLDSNVNKIINDIKTTKSFFYFNKSRSDEKEESEGDHFRKTTRRDIDSSKSSVKRRPLVEEVLKKGKNDSKEHITSENGADENDANENGENENARRCDTSVGGEMINAKTTFPEEPYDSPEKRNYIDKVNAIYSYYDDKFSFVKVQTDNFTSKRDSFNVLRDHFSDSELLSFHNSNKKEQKLRNMLRKKGMNARDGDILNRDSSGSSEFIAHARTYKNVRSDIDEADEYLDHKDTGQLLEKVIEHLNIKLKDTICRYLKEIKKLNKANCTLSNKLENAVENNDEQAQEIRDLQKRICLIKEQKTEMNKIIEGYELQMDLSKKLTNEQKDEGKNRIALEQEIKNLKRELNLANCLNDKMKDEKLLLHEKIKNKDNKLKREKHKLRTANGLISEKSDLLVQLQLGNNVDISHKECIERKHTTACKTKNKIINRYGSDTILDNYERIKNKLFESNEKCYFLSKTNFELFKVLKKKKKKIDTLNKEMSYLRCFMMGRGNPINSYSHHMKEERISDAMNPNYTEDSRPNEHASTLVRKKRRILLNLCETGEMNTVNITSETDITEKVHIRGETDINGKAELSEEKIRSLDNDLRTITSEHELLRKRYELLYVKYIRLLKRESRKNKDFTFIEEKKKEILSPKCDILHSFYFKKGKTMFNQNHRRNNKLIDYIKAKVIYRKQNGKNEYGNYKESSDCGDCGDYGDVEFYISNEILRRMDVKDIVNIRYIYSYGNVMRTAHSLSPQKSHSNDYTRCMCLGAKHKRIVCSLSSEKKKYLPFAIL
ncbi:conserved Plasmodium protein, unknown function [Plasmodium ovale curtisi]|uniref:Uncharacterized protein n=1 Tax=Plasmodium ovale curtisi TaxID=864141 RepID=A0A1A8W5M6_PLAOA|nr:conserved Plasmodium protein, unknown function [Plasmodium ovale curtisi]